MELVFLGTGGGRWMTITQKLYTGGFRLHDDLNLHIDPGSGAVARAKERGVNVLATDGVLVSHCHPDHYTDVEVMVEAMTKGMTKKRGVVGASLSVLEGSESLGPAVSNYHKSMLAEEVALSPGTTFKLEDIGVEALKTVHSDPTGVGFKLFTDYGVITYTGDTEYFESMPDFYNDSTVMIINVIRPKNDKLKWHLCSDDVVKILNESKPKTAVITHFGMKMLPHREKEAARIEDLTGVKTIAARDGLKLKLE